MATFAVLKRLAPRAAFVAILLGVAPGSVVGETFGSGDDAFELPLVTVGDPGNPADTTGVPNPAGSVGDTYQIGKYEVPEHAVRSANALSEAAGEPLGITLDTRGPDKPATGLSWFEAARFVNWLNADLGLPPAYHFDAAGAFQLWAPGDPGYDPRNPYRSTQARYFLPTADEWYKAAFYDPQAGVYWDYPTGSNDPPTPVSSGTDPGTAVWNVATGPADVTLAGGESPYGTVGQGGNVLEWEETALDLTNDLFDDRRGVRGNSWILSITPLGMAAEFRNAGFPDAQPQDVGFRIVAVPEPLSGLLAAIAGLLAPARRRRAGASHKYSQRRGPAGFERLEPRRVLATLVVDSIGDTADPVDDGSITLREALQ